MEVSAEKGTLITNNTNSITEEINANRHRLETASSFKYRGSVVTDEGPKPAIITRIAQKT